MPSRRKQSKFETTQNAYQLASIQIAGGNIGLPVASVGFSLFLSLGLFNSVLNIVIGNLIILMVSYIFIRMSFRHRLNAVENVERYFGWLGAKGFALCILVTMIGWLAIGLSRLSDGLDILDMNPSWLFPGALIGFLASLVTLFSIRGIRWLGVLVTPLLIILLTVCLVMAASPPPQQLPEFSNRLNLTGISPIVIVLLASIADYPTFYRHSVSVRHGMYSLWVIFLATVFSQVSIIFLGGNSPKSIYTLVDPQSIQSNGLLFIVACFLVVSTLGSAAWNIYAASVGWESLFPALKDRTEYAVIGLGATVLLYALPIKVVLETIVAYGDITITAILTITVANYLLDNLIKKTSKRLRHTINNGGWVVSTIVAVSCKAGVLFPDFDPVWLAICVSGLIVVLGLLIRETFGRVTVR
jgi:purine-cytosine permease-like protein